jgi:hypothetical protein
VLTHQTSSCVMRSESASVGHIVTSELMTGSAPGKTRTCSDRLLHKKMSSTQTNEVKHYSGE